MKRFFSLKLVSISLIALVASPSAYAIKKCKDAEGNWHYGDFAEDKCAESKVTTLNDRGFVTETLDAPKTEEEMRAAEALQQKEEEELARLKKEQDERNRILSIYEREADIDRQRDNQLASVDGNIRVHKAYLKQMDGKIARLKDKSVKAKGRLKKDLETELAASQARVKEFSAELKRLEAQKISIAEKFANEKKLYRELTKSR